MGCYIGYTIFIAGYREVRVMWAGFAFGFAYGYGYAYGYAGYSDAKAWVHTPQALAMAAYGHGYAMAIYAYAGYAYDCDKVQSRSSVPNRKIIDS